MPAGLLLGGLSLAGGFLKNLQAKKQAKEFNKQIDGTGQYTADAGIGGNLSLAKNLYNGRMAGASSAEANIMTSQATAADFAEKNSTDSSQALALISAIQGGTNNATVDLADREAIDQQRRFGQLQSAVSLSNQEKAKVWADKLRLLNMKLGVSGVKNDNINSAREDMFSGLGMIGMDIFGQGKKKKSLAEFGTYG